MWRQEVDEAATRTLKVTTEEEKAEHVKRPMHALLHGHAVLVYRVRMRENGSI